MTTSTINLAASPTGVASELGITFTEAWLTVLTAAGVYAGAILFSRLFGQRHLATSSGYDVVFVFALGSPTAGSSTRGSIGPTSASSSSTRHSG